MPVKNYTAKVLDKQVIAKNTYYLKIQMPQGEPLFFQSGQFVTIEVAPNTRRSYSIASSPVHSDYLDLIADSNGKGPGSLFFENAKPGQEVKFLAPLGQFFFKESARPSYFFATGTGVVPFMSMVEYQLEKLQNKKELKVFSSFRFREDVFGQEPFARLAANFPNFRYILTVTKPDTEWQGLKGRISDYYKTEITSTDIDAYICGSQNSISGIKQDLLLLGVPERQIYYEKYY